MPTEETTLKDLLDAYEDNHLDFRSLVQLIVERFKEIGSHQEDPEKDWSDHRTAEQFADEDDGHWINSAIGRGIINYQQALVIEKAIHEALSEDQSEEPFLM